MPNSTVLFDGPGPLPVKAVFQAPTDGPVAFVVTGTAYTNSAANAIGIQLYLDGSLLGEPALCWANENNNHQAVRMTFTPYEGLSEGDHTIQVAIALDPTVTDVNDNFQVTLLY